MIDKHPDIEKDFDNYIAIPSGWNKEEYLTARAFFSEFNNRRLNEIAESVGIVYGVDNIFGISPQELADTIIFEGGSKEEIQALVESLRKKV